MDSFDIRYLAFIIGFFAVFAFVLYILMGQTKRKLQKIGMTIGFTCLLAVKVLFPLGEAWQDKVLGPIHDHQAYRERRYVVKNDMSRYDAAEDGSGGLHPKLLEDTDTRKILTGENEHYYFIHLSMHDGTIIAECSPNVDGETDLYIVENDTVRMIGSKEASDIRTVWRGDIKQYSKKTEDGNYEDVYSKVDGLPLTMLQKFFVNEHLPANTAFAIALIISILLTHLCFRKKNEQGEEVSDESEEHNN